MTDQQLDHTVEDQGSEAQAATGLELSLDEIPTPATDGQTRRARLMRPVSAVNKPISGVLAIARTSVTAARSGVDSVAARLPGTIRTTRAAAHDTTSALQSLPDPTLRSLAATSVGIGVGFYLVSGRRSALAAGVAPALIMRTAIAVRPVDPGIPNRT
jgi:hypothetical protein